MGKFTEITSIHEYNRKIANSLESLCLAQFVIIYDYVSHKNISANPTKSVSELKSDKFSNCIISWESYDPNIDSIQKLPHLIEISSEPKTFFKLRTYPSVLRIHKLSFRYSFS